MLTLDREQCTIIGVSSKREWLVTNGIGGYAAGTVAGNLSRSYHGVLIAALNPPLGRTLLLAKIDETVIYRDKLYKLHTDQKSPGHYEPQGYMYLERFSTLHGIPTWEYLIEDARLKKQIWMEPEENTTYIRFELVKAVEPLELRLTALANYRNHHASTQAEQIDLRVAPIEHGLEISMLDNESFRLVLPGADTNPWHEWLTGYYKATEDYRGEPAYDDHLLVGQFSISLAPGESHVFAATISNVLPDFQGALRRRIAHQENCLRRSTFELNEPYLSDVVLAADQFIVKRGSEHHLEGKTILAGYPWFSDWGRDTMIALPGLTMPTGRYEDAASILRTFIYYVSNGMIPNRFPDEGEDPEYNTVDATLWYFEALRAYLAQTGDETLLQELFPVLVEIVDWHLSGTRFDIQVDDNDGLLRAGTPETQLTWMDVKIDGWVVTPRNGKAIEINALWYNALRTMSAFALIMDEDPKIYIQLADRVRESFARFWNGEAGYCYDVIDSPDGNDASLRPNQLFAVSLHYAEDLLTQAQQRAILDVCERHLLTPRGLRSLSPQHPDYKGHYGGDRLSRDGAYHQGTVWGWLIGPFVSAHLRAYGDKERVKRLATPLLDHLLDGAIGTLSEVFDGDAPHDPRGCFAQAWTVAEVLRVLYQLR